MSKRITIKCPACSATLAAPVSAAGKTVLCPKCRTGIPMQKPTTRTLASINEQAGDAHNRNGQLTEGTAPTRRRVLGKGERLLLRVTIGMAVLLTITTTILINSGTEQSRTSRPAEERDQALGDNEHLPTLDIDAMVARIQKQLEPPKTNVEGADRDLADLKRLVPDHPIHVDILPALTIARSMEYAEAGRIADAIRELDTATTLGVAEPQLRHVKQTLIDALLKQAEANLRNEHYPQVLADCDEILKLGGPILEVTPIALIALTALTDRAATGPEMDSAIERLQAWKRNQNLQGVNEKLFILYLRRSNLAYSRGDLGLALDQFQILLAAGHRNAEVLQFGAALAAAMTAAFEKDRSKLNRKRALLVIELLKQDAVTSEAVMLTRIGLAKALLSDTTSEDRDGDLDFAAQNVDQARSRGIKIEQHSEFLKDLARALIKRGFEQINQERIAEGLDDLETAIRMDPGQKGLLLGRLKRLTAEVRDQLPLSLKELLAADALADTSDEIWKLIPAEAAAFSVVRNMQGFSHKVDDLARLMQLDPPGLLQFACEKSKIRDGLARDGSLCWVQLPVSAEALPRETGAIYFVPTSSFQTMIRPLTPGANEGQPATNPALIPVNMNDSSGLAARLKSHGVFAFRNDEKSLSATLRSA